MILNKKINLNFNDGNNSKINNNFGGNEIG